MKKKKIVRIVSVPHAFVHIEEGLKYLINNNFEVILVSSYDSYIDDYLKKFRPNTIRFKEISIEREINLISDLISSFKLFLFLLKERPDITHSSTPKAGIVTALASFLARVPVRLHTFTGQRWATLNGLKKHLLIYLDKVIISLSTSALADSPSQVTFLKSNGLDPVDCLLRGSYGGVDLERFHPRKKTEYKNQIRKNLDLDNDARVGLFLGRINKDKGVDELLEIFSKFENKKWFLLVVGPYEKETNPILEQNEKILFYHPQIKFLGMKNDPVPYLAASDFMVLPSFREGFGTVVIEAAGLELPTLGRRISGLIDSISDGESGVLFENSEQFTSGLESFFKDSELTANLGKMARLRALKYFDSNILAKAQTDFYRERLNALSNSQSATIVEKS